MQSWLTLVILALFLVWGVLSIIMGMVLRRMPGPSRFILSFVFFVLSAGIFGGGAYCLMEYVTNKGPDDVGVLWHVGTPLTTQLGRASKASYSVIGFTADADNSGSGVYRLHFRRDNRHGVISSHYNKPARKFDRDEIIIEDL